MAGTDYSIFDHMIEGVQILDRDLRYVYVNDAVATHGKSTKSALVGSIMRESYPGIEKTEVFRLIRACLDQQRFRQMINEFHFPDGSVGYFQLRIQPVPEGVLILSFDITEQRLAELAMHDLNAVLESRVAERTAELRARNEELQQIAYIASHDLQEPLRTMRSYVEVLAEECRDQLDETARASLDFIVGASVRMQGLIRALLDYARLDGAKQRQRTDTRVLLDDVLADLAALIERTGAQVEVGELPTLEVYRAEFGQLLQNLLSNAIKFRKPDVPPHVRVEAEPQGDRWLFRVIDNGIGFDMRFKDKIFLLFQRLHPRTAYEGAGIGLAHCKKIVTLHGGEIGCQSEPGVGSTFFFAIPAHGASGVRP